MDKSHAIAVLEELAALLALDGENPFKVRAYKNAVRAIAGLEDDVAELARSGRLRDVRGIGASIAETLAVLAEDGPLPYLAELRERFPPAYRELVAVEGVGPKRAQQLRAELGVGSIAELDYACHESRLQALRGFGEASQRKILAGIARARQHKSRRRFDRALSAAAPLLAKIRDHRATVKADIAGSLRRRMETVRNVDLVVASGDRAHTTELLASPDDGIEVVSSGETRTTLRLASGLMVEVRVVTPTQYPYALLHYTGSAEHNARLRAQAEKRGLELSEYRLVRRGDGSLVDCDSEDDVYRALGLTPVAPELREDRGEIEAAENGSLPQLVPYGALRGAVHNHTNWSDGRNTLDEMVAAARGLGWSYLGITDHSQSSTYANGLRPDRVVQQQAQIDAVNRSLDGFRVLKGTECDILADGSLDYDADLRRRFELIVASIHSRFDLDREAMTRRLLTAIRDPQVMVLGHLTGRLLQGRIGYEVDVEAVVDACASEGVAIEINSSPHRLELDWRHLRRAKARGLKLFVNPDAHRVSDLANVELGLGLARKGWLETADIVNTRELDGVLAFFAERRKRATGTCRP